MTVERKRLLILGTGFGAFALLRGIDQRAYDVTVVSPRNHFLFTPLLPSTTVGTIEYRTIIEPVRRRCPGAQFLLAKAVQIDLAARTVHCQSVVTDAVWEQPYDVLAVAVGCVTNTFGVPGVEQHAHFLKEIEDARKIRHTLVVNLERASLPGTSEEEQARLLHFVSVGAGPTGVRFAGELFDLLRQDLPRSYPHLASKVRVTLLDSSQSVLNAYDEALRDYVRQEFLHRGVTIHTGTRVQEVTDRGLYLPNHEFLPCGMVLWSAGFARNPVIAALENEKDRSGRLLTDDTLQVLGQSDVYALGDCACPTGQTLPQLAQVAEQQGRYLAKSLNARGQRLPAVPFRWKHWGTSSFIGGAAAVADTAHTHAKLSGYWAYQQWRAAIWTQLVSVRSKVLVPLDRFRAFAFGRDISKL